MTTGRVTGELPARSSSGLGLDVGYEIQTWWHLEQVVKLSQLIYLYLYPFENLRLFE